MNSQMFAFYNLFKLMLCVISMFFCNIVARQFVNPITNPLKLYGLCRKIGNTIDENRNVNPIIITTSTTITTSGSYFLNNDIAGQITIASDNVNLDLGAHTITVSSGAGITVNDSKKNIRITNGKINSKDNANGISMGKGTKNVCISWILISSSQKNTGNGMEVNSGSSGCHITGCTIYGFENGIYLYGEANSEIKDCSIGYVSDKGGDCAIYDSNTNGIKLVYTKKTTIESVLISKIGTGEQAFEPARGISMDHCDHNTIKNCKISGVFTPSTGLGPAGIALDESTYNVIISCMIEKIKSTFEATGVFFYYNCDYNVIILNTIQDLSSISEPAQGIWNYFDSSKNNVIFYNYFNNIQGNDSVGIFLNGKNAVVKKNIIQQCKGDGNNIGIYIDAENEKCQIDGNIMQDCSTWAIKDESPINNAMITSNKAHNCGAGDPFSSNTAIRTQNLLLGVPNPYDNIYSST